MRWPFLLLLVLTGCTTRMYAPAAFTGTTDGVEALAGSGGIQASYGHTSGVRINAVGSLEGRFVLVGPGYGHYWKRKRMRLEAGGDVWLGGSGADRTAAWWVSGQGAVLHRRRFAEVGGILRLTLVHHTHRGGRGILPAKVDGLFAEPGALWRFRIDPIVVDVQLGVSVPVAQNSELGAEVPVMGSVGFGYSF